MLPKTSNQIETERLVLKPLKSDHDRFIFSLLSNKDHTRYLSLPTISSQDEADKILSGMLSDHRNRIWAIFNRFNDEFVGLCGYVNDSVNVNFIYSICESKKNLGYATEACRKALEIGAMMLGTDLVELNIHSGNKASLKIAENLGFKLSTEYLRDYPQDNFPVKVYVYHKIFAKDQ